MPISPSPASADAAGPASVQRDDDPVLSVGELRRRHRPSPVAAAPSLNVGAVRHSSAELPARASSSHLSRVFGNVILLVLVLCICVLLARRLCMMAGCL